MNKPVNYSLLVHKLHIDQESFSSKPTKPNKISKRICLLPEEVTAKNLATEITKGKTCLLGHIKNNRSNDNWESQSLFALDFDNSTTKKDPVTGKSIKIQVDNPLSFNDVLNRLKEYKLDCCFAYPTFNHTEDWVKFRVVFQLNQVIICRVYRDSIQNALFMLFPEADKSCGDSSRLFYGTDKELIYENYDYCLDLNSLFDFALFYAGKNSDSSNYKRDLNTALKKLNFSKNRSKCEVPYIYYIETPTDTSISLKNKEKTSLKTIEGVNFEKLREQVKILDDFMNPKIKLLHPALVGLATNLRWIKGGQNLFLECLKANPDYNYDEKETILKYCKFRDYYPKRLQDFSPYPEDYRFKNILEAAKDKQIIRIAAHSKIPMKQARSELNSTLGEILASNDTNIHIIRAATGLGKTHNSLGLPNVLIAFPNHKLKDEVAEKMKTEYLLTPSSNELPDKIKQQLDYLYSRGAWSRATSYLKDQSNYSSEVAKYREQLLTAYRSDKTVLTTHQKALRINWRHQTIIFDEDPFKVLLPISKITFNDLHNLEPDNTSDRQVLKSIIHDLTYKPNNTVFSMNLIVFEDFGGLVDKVLNNSSKFNSNVLDFFDCDYYLISAKDGSIEYIRRETLPEDKKVIILSATANEQLYRLMYGDRVKFYELSNVEPTGTVIQHTVQSCSRTSLNNNLERIVNLVHEHGNQNLPTITFANYKESLRNKGINVYEDNHFGKAVGSNALEGKNINVIGTPHFSSNTIALYAHAVKIPIKASDLIKPNNMTVEHNGFRFWFNTYENPDLRNIQFFCIESELRQAIGRSRFNTTEVIVNLYSNYPLPEACVTEDEKAKAANKSNLAKGS